MKEKDILCIHHTDLDGSASAAIVGLNAKRNGMNIDYVAYNYKDEIPDASGYKEVWVVDVSFGTRTADIFKSWKQQGIRVGWIDHHKTAFNKEGMVLSDTKEDSIMGYRSTKTAACELAWDFFFTGEDMPELIAYLAAYDTWNKDRFDWDDVMAVQYGARAEFGMTNPGNILKDLEEKSSKNNAFGKIYMLKMKGRDILDFLEEKHKSECEQYAFEAKVQIRGRHNFNVVFKRDFKAICINTLEFSSSTFDSIYDPDKHKMMVAFAFVPTIQQFRVSIYSTHKDIDCGMLAKSILGGGGHKGAAGFHLSLNQMDYFLIKKQLEFYPEIEFFPEM